MILIINQHKGDWEEFKSNIEDYFAHRIDDSFYMSIVYDNGHSTLTDRQLNWIANINMYNNKAIHISIHYKNEGLSPSRCTAIQYARATDYWSRFTMILFGCTNSRFKSQLDEYLENKLISKYATLIPCRYPVDNLDVKLDEKFNSYDYISFSDYISNDFKPDYTLCIPKDEWKEITYLDEPYYPEEIMLYNISNRTEGRLRIYPSILQEAWYNKDGMTKTFSRSTVLRNRNGFSDRARILLDAYLDGKLNLSIGKLKVLVYDLVTLTPNLDIHKYTGTLLEPVIMWALNKWLKDPNYKHTITFNE